MAFVRIEPSGCCERKGLVQIRFSMYLEPNDYGYEKYHIQVPVIPKGGYPGEMVRVEVKDAYSDGKTNIPLDQGDYNRWFESLPKVWQNSPFHNHFIYVEPETPDAVIMSIGKAFLEEAYIRWATGDSMDIKNPPVKFDIFADEDKLAEIANKVGHLKELSLTEYI